MKALIYLATITLALFNTTLCADDQSGNKTPDDVFQRVIQLKQQVQLLRQADNISEQWPNVEKPYDLSPRHVLQKGLEVLDKIKRLRRIHKMGPITVPLFPTRNITPNEVFYIVDRLIEELKIFPSLTGVKLNLVKNITGKTPDDVYQELWNISLAMNSLLGVRGLKPTDVYTQSLKILEQVKFLRISQSLSLHIPPPDKTIGKRPNHTLQQAYAFLGKIATAQHNLWIEPIAVPTVPPREIKPGEVYDALLRAQAELERIKYRLGIERDIGSTTLKGQKTPDDVLFNLAWATKMMPLFPNETTIKQYPKQSLNKNANHLFALTQHIIEELLEYRGQRGIQTTPREVPKQAYLQALNVYQKTMHVMEKVNKIRQQEGLGRLALPSDHLRQTTLTETYDLIIRLDAELQIFYDKIGMPAQLAELSNKKNYRNKTESDVFQQMWVISYLLDSVLGSEGYTPADVFNLAQQVVNDLTIIGHATGRTINDLTLPTLIQGIQPTDVLKQAQIMTHMLITLKFRIGLLGQAQPLLPTPNQVTPDDVHNGVELILSELEHIKVHLNIVEAAPLNRTTSKKIPGEVLQQLQLATRLLQGFIK